MFGRATKAVSICPPAYYADIVCTRARIHSGDILDQSDTATVVSEVSQSGLPQGIREALARRVHKNIANDMYYI